MNSIILKNILGWKSSRRLVCIESDDWGSIRIPNTNTRDFLIHKGYKLNANYFTKYDGLESQKDLENLFNELLGIKDHKGNYPIFTTLHILGNPDFNSIFESNYKSYIFQPLSATYEDYGENPDSMKRLWLSGIEKNIIVPAFHGREHVNVPRWLRALQNPDFNATREFFKYKISGVHNWIANEKREEFQASFDPDFIADTPFFNSIISDGLHLFKNYFGFGSNYFVPPNGRLPLDCQKNLSNLGIQFLNTIKWGVQKDCNLKRKRVFRYLGMKSNLNFRFITRNVFFEPSSNSHQDWIGKALKEISVAFLLHKPAVICTHRVNYTSRIETFNRDSNLKRLSILLKKIVSNWPDVEFVSTPELGELISTKT